MKSINEAVVLDHFVQLMKSKEITFLVKHEDLYAEIEEHIIHLKSDCGMNRKIQSAKKLWKILFRTSMSYIDPDQRGYDDLFGFFDEYVEFEELIFASDSFYRDHTLHCLWVYFLGVYIRTIGDFDEVIQLDNVVNLHLDFLKYIIAERSNHKNVGVIAQVVDLMEAAVKYEQSIFCVSSLTHDLGYPIKKISKINKSIKKILPYFGINNFDEFNFHYDSIQQHFNERFIDLISLEPDYSLTVKVNNTEDEKKVQKIFKNISKTLSNGDVGFDLEAFKSINIEDQNLVIDSFVAKRREFKNYPTEIRYSDDIEQYQHGIMSAFLLTKVVQSFRHMEYISNNNKQDLTLHAKANYPRFIVKQTILRAITDHTSTGYQIVSIDEHSELLTFIDELEEFSRISRANQNREFINEFCDTQLYMQDGIFVINFLFNNAEINGLDPELAFKGRCKKLLSLFNIEKLDSKLHLKLSCIGDLPYDKNTYTIEIKNKFAKITINDEEQIIPNYLKTNDFMTREGYESL